MIFSDFSEYFCRSISNEYFYKSLGHRLSTATEIFLQTCVFNLYLAKLTDINRNGVQITKTVRIYGSKHIIFSNFSRDDDLYLA